MSLGKKLLNAICGLFLVFFCLAAIVAMIGSFDFWLFLHLPAQPVPEKRQFFIARGTDGLTVARFLQSQGVIRNGYEFYLLALLKHATHRFQAGEYAFSTLDLPQQVLDKIVNGKVVIYVVTLPEGSTLRDIAAIVARDRLAKSSEIVAAALSGRIAKSLDVKANTLEGYLFPDTYRFKKPISAAAILGRMVAQFRRKLPAGWQNRDKELGLTLNQVVTMASMIEKEAKVDSERPIIAGVFYNRLKNNMPLQSDPTAVYDLPGFSGPVTPADLKRQSPYNTYLHKGLPPGPICNPGEKSILAALYPAKVPYFYFVSNNATTHQFSVTLKEQQEAISNSRKAKNEADKK
ncbi:MAG: endolytic transglycosylase MltG [Syntrophobacteraceae bacterium]